MIYAVAAGVELHHLMRQHERIILTYWVVGNVSLLRDPVLKGTKLFYWDLV